MVLVFSGGRRVADGRTGERDPVSPGSYTVKLGSGTNKQMMKFSADVSAGQTTTIGPKWAGLVIQVVDTQNIPHRAQYEISRADDRELFGIGCGADTLQAEPLQT